MKHLAKLIEKILKLQNKKINQGNCFNQFWYYNREKRRSKSRSRERYPKKRKRESKFVDKPEDYVSNIGKCYSRWLIIIN